MFEISYSLLLAMLTVRSSNHQTKKFIEDTIAQYNWDDQTDRAYRDNCRGIIEQAFQNMGYQGDLVVVFYQTDGSFYCDTSYATRGDRRLALVRMFYNHPKQLINNIQNYAIAGHEAAHVLHKTLEIKAAYEGASTALIHAGLLKHGIQALPLLTVPGAQPYVFSLAGFLFLASYIAKNINLLIKPALSRYLEKDADLTAAKKIGAALPLANHFRENLSNEHLPKFSFLNTHPSHESRIRYLQAFHHNHQRLQYG